MNQLLDRKHHADLWQFDNDTADIYRRQMVPFYLLEVESNRYPVYVDNSNINSSLTTDYKIKNVNVHVSASVLKQLKQKWSAPHSAGANIDTGHLTLPHQGEKLSSRGAPSSSARGANAADLPFGDQHGHVDTHINLTNISLLSTADKIIKICEK